MLILRLSPFRDVDRSTPHLFLAQAARAAVPGCYLDFCFFPSRLERRLLEQNKIPLITGIESFKSLEDFDLALFSCSFHLELLNLPYLLLGSGIPLWAGQRGEEWPSLLLGGSSALASQALIGDSGDCLADGLFFGEGEDEAEELIRRLAALRDLPKMERLRQAAEAVEGFWPAGDPARSVRQAVCRRPQARQQALRYPVLSGPEAGTARLQITYGCPFRCSFCFEGHDRHPYRELPAAELLEAARELKRQSGASTLELASFNVNTHPDLPLLLLELNRLFQQVNFMSQRADILGSTPGLLELEVLAGKRTYTLGIEGISERQRAFMAKRLTEEQIRGLAERLLAARIREVKLFYLLSGYETEEDFREFTEFLGWLHAKRDGCGSGVRLIFSFNRLMRMPFTPLQFDRLLLEEAFWQPLVRRAQDCCQANGFEFRLASTWAEYAVAQVLCMGGSWLHEPLRLLAESGLFYDRRLEPRAWRLLARWLKEHPELKERLIAEKPFDFPFALGFVRTPVDRAVLWRRYLAAKEALRGVPAPAPVPALRLSPDIPAALQETKRAKQRAKPFYLFVHVPRSAAGASLEWLNAQLMRALLERQPELTENLLAVRESLFSSPQGRPRWPPWFGRTIFAFLAWEPTAAREALRAGQFEEFQVLPDDLPAAFSPGAYREARIVLRLPGLLFPEADRKLMEYLAAEHAPVTTRRDSASEAGFLLEPGEKTKKKKLLYSGRCEPTPEGWRIELAVGPRFDPACYLDRFPHSWAWERAIAEIAAVEV